MSANDAGRGPRTAPRLTTEPAMPKRKRERRRLSDEEPPVEHGRNSGGRDSRGRFMPGNKLARGNAGQRERGRLRRALDRAVSNADLDRVIASMVHRARRGDVRAARLLLDRIGGTSRAEADTETVTFDLGDLETLDDCARAQREITAAASSGSITLSVSTRLSWLVEKTTARLSDRTTRADQAPNWSGEAPPPDYV